LLRISIRSSLELQKAPFAGKGIWLGKSAGTMLGALVLLLASQFCSTLASANSAVTSETLTFTVYFDGFVQVNQELELQQSYPSVNVSLLGEAYEELLIVDEQNLPLDYELSCGEAIIYSLGTSQIRLSYFTADLTSKTGKYWTLSAEVSINATVVLPENASVISLNNVPELIESFNNKVSIVMPPGILEITYISERSLYQQPQSYETWLIALIFIPIAASAAFIVWFLKRKKPPQKNELRPELDLEKLLEKEKHLRSEEVQVIRFLAEKHGTALEAELYEKLNLPRTTTWRLLKRLEKMEILDIRKSRRQNVVSVRRKYMKK
jgi:uncharacterized membrane protein